MSVNFHVLANSVVVSFDGENYPIARGDGRYESVVKAISDGELEQLRDLVRVDKVFTDLSKGLEFKDNTIYIDGEAVSEELADRILAHKEQNIPFEYLLKFVRKLKENPSFNSRTMLYRFLEHNGHPITQDGNFIAYRKVTNNFKDFHSGKFDNSVGAVCEMPRDKVDDNPNNTCSSGLHVACWQYSSRSFHQNDGVMVEVEVDPRDVVCVPTDYNGTKMRVCKFVVKAVCSQPRPDNEQVYRYSDWEDDGFDWEDDEDSVYSIW